MPYLLYLGEKGDEIRIFCLHILGHLLEMVKVEYFSFEAPLQQAFRLLQTIPFQDLDDDVGEDVCGNYIITYIYSALCEAFCGTRSVSCYQFVNEMPMLSSGHRRESSFLTVQCLVLE